MERNEDGHFLRHIADPRPTFRSRGATRPHLVAFSEHAPHANMSFAVPLVSGIDFLGQTITAVPPLVNPVVALIGTGFVTYFAHIIRVLLTPRFNNIHPRAQARKLEGAASRVSILESGLSAELGSHRQPPLTCRCFPE